MAVRRSRVPVVILACVLALLALDYAAWRVATGRMLDAYLNWQASLASSGWRVDSDSPVPTGWPFAAQIRLNHARLGQAATNGFAWSAARVSFGVSLLHPRLLVVEPGGDQVLSSPNWPPVHWHADQLRVTAPLAAPIRSAHAEGSGLSVKTPVGAAVADAATIDADWAADAVRVQLTTGPISMPEGHHWALGRSLTLATLDVVAHGAWPPGNPSHAAAQWRDAAGSLDVNRLALQWGTLNVSGSGQATLDANLQPDAHLSLKIADPQAAVSMLADEGAIGRGAATAAEAVLGLLAMPARLAGQPAVLNLPARIKDGALTLGRIPVLRVPPIPWPAG